MDSENNQQQNNQAASFVVYTEKPNYDGKGTHKVTDPKLSKTIDMGSIEDVGELQFLGTVHYIYINPGLGNKASVVVYYKGDTLNCYKFSADFDDALQAICAKLCVYEKQANIDYTKLPKKVIRIINLKRKYILSFQQTSVDPHTFIQCVKGYQVTPTLFNNWINLEVIPKS
eukprot:CAMPEP_0168542842 /NCGR_PEP_ID=MMETSP0413-20121227/1560_1 /TAXON_ID=136452 /ORGANISM="Filamoeba nolandi, Strain NC-AS-23-1" /LENGTH=171 /DNA_ID=CAMNT_0008572739 /DNA_START=46 /DNA_END=558 /DNA_ORIENTATION=-